MEQLALDLVPGGGVLAIRGQEPGTLDAASVTGEVDTATGAISNLDFAVPPVDFEIDITSPLVATVYIRATFTQVGTGTGSVDSDGNLVVRAQVRADIDVKVSNPPIIATVCTPPPITLTLRSETPYDPDTGQVTVEDPNFAIGQVPSGGCVDAVRGEVNTILGGAGHRIALTVEGDLPRPEPAREESVTTIVVAPETSAPFGTEVTMTATVARGLEVPAEVTDEPSGFVAFMHKDRILGLGELIDGEAEYQTSSLPVADYQVSAHYRGDGIYGPSTSNAVPYLVQAGPNVRWNVPAFIPTHTGQATEIDFTVENTRFGQDLHVRPELTVLPFSGVLRSANFGLRWWDDGLGDWVVPDYTSEVRDVVVGLPGGEPLGRSERFTRRLSAEFGLPGGPQVVPGRAQLIVKLWAVDPVTGDKILDPVTGQPMLVGEATAETGLVPPSRLETRVVVGGRVGRGAAARDFIFSPHTVRAGQSTSAEITIGIPTANAAGVSPNIDLGGGVVTITIGGRPVAFGSPSSLARGPAYVVHQQVRGRFVFQVPPDMPPGVHEVVVSYLGNSYARPSQWNAASVTTFPSVVVPSPVGRTTLTVLPPAGSAYDCQIPTLPAERFGINVEAVASVPRVAPAGTTLDVSQVSASLLLPRGRAVDVNTAEMFGDGMTKVGDEYAGSGAGTYTLEGIDVVLGAGGDETVPGGEGRAGAMEYDRAANALDMGEDSAPGPDPHPDRPVHLHDFDLQVPVPDEPGRSRPVTLESLQVRLMSNSLPGGFPLVMTCRPVGDAVLLGEVTAAGIVVETLPGVRGRAGRDVAVRAVPVPAVPGGGVMFRAGGEVVGITPVNPDTGAAEIVVDDLAVGSHELTAELFNSVVAPAYRSEPVSFEVLPAHECAAFVEDGNAAVVRLVYMELLRRCPDQAGFDYWVDRLDGGTSPEVFARSIARTPEAVGVVVDDAYQTMLGRPADGEGRAFWTGRLQGHGRYDTLLADLASSDEFWAKAGSSNEGFVTRVYERLLNRAPDQAGLDYWVGRLDAGASRRALVLSLANLDEPLGRLVALSYDEILSRDPRSAERVDGIGHLRDTGDRSALYAELIGRPEFATRAQGFPNPED